ncbi:MAG: hypothetical protein M5U26_08505 [Planctomycetota bacterium]|nr:hypothetical protein [Planctomycetota bacterium]
MIVRVADGSEVNLRKDFPSTSWPAVPSDEALAEKGLQRVAEAEKPALREGEYADPGALEQLDGQWTRTWVVKQAAPPVVESDEEVLARVAAAKPDELSDEDLRRAVVALANKKA